MTQEPRTVAAVSMALQCNGDFAHDRVCHGLVDLVRHLEARPASVVMVDLENAPLHLLGELEPVISRFADSRFIVLGSQMRSECLLEAMQIGARHFLLKASIEAELPGVLERLLPSSGLRSGRRGGAVVTVLSAAGGCGATTVAVNLVNELTLAASSPGLLIDLDTHYGAAAAALGVTAPYGIADVLAAGDRIDEHLISSTAVSAGEHLRVLVSRASVEPGELTVIEPQYLNRTLEISRRVYAATVIDAPRVSYDIAASLAQVSSLTLVVLQLAVKDLHTAKGLVNTLLSRGVTDSALLPVINRFQKRGSMIGLEQAQEVLGGLKPLCLVNDYQAALSAINYGQPLSKAAPRSRLRQDIMALSSAVREMLGRQAPAPAGGRR